MELEVCSSIPCTPLPLSTSRTYPAPQTSTGATRVAAMIIANQGAAALWPCRHAAPVEETVPQPYLALAPRLASPSTTPHPLVTGIWSPPTPTPLPEHAVCRPSSPEAVPHIELAQLASTPPTVPLSSPTP